MPKPTPPPRAATPKDLRAPPNAGAAAWKPPPRKPPPTGPARPPPPPTRPPPPKPPPPPPWGPAHAAKVSAIDVMPTRLSNLNFFILQRSLHFRFAAIAHAGDFLVPRLGRAPCLHLRVRATRRCSER